MAKTKGIKNETRRVKLSNKASTRAVLVGALVVIVLELIRADIIPVKGTIISWLENGCLKAIYPFIASWYRNACQFAGNSFTQNTAFFSVFCSITFFIIGRFKEGIIGVPLEELLHTEFNRNIIERRKIFVWFSPLWVGISIVMGAELFAFYVGMLTLANVIFSAYCAAIATDRSKQEKIAWYMVEQELKDIAQEVCKQNTDNKRVVLSDRCLSKTLAKMVNAMQDSKNLFFDIGESIFDWFLNPAHYQFNFCADIVYYNIQYMVCAFLKDRESDKTLDYRFAFLEKQMKKVEERLEDPAALENSMESPDEEKLGIAQEVSEAVIVGIICGIVSSGSKQGKELIEDMFSAPWIPLSVKLRKLYILLYLEHLYSNGEEDAAISWIKILSISYVNFFGDIHYLLMDKYQKNFLRYFILWENTKKDLTSVDLGPYRNLLYDIRTLEKADSETKSFIGCILKGRKRITNE